MSNDAPLLLDVTRLIWRRSKKRLPTGIDRVCLAYVSHFADRAQAVVQHDRFRGILDRKASRELFELLATPHPWFRTSLLGGAVRNFRRLHERGEGRLYLNIGHTGLNSPGYARWCAREDVRPVYLVHDLIPITHPEFCRPGETAKHRERMRTVVSTASAVIGNSQATIDDLATFAAAEGRPMPPHAVAWLGTEENLSTNLFSPSPPKPTFVILGTIEGRKNHDMLLRVWTRLVERLGSRAPKLLIIGQRGWQAQSVFDRLDRPQDLKGAVIELNRCADEAIARHLSSARALLFPSIIEGYGLPLIEALATQVPAIASDLPVFREIAGDLPDYLDPRDESAWERTILDYASDASPARAAQKRRMQGFAPPTWDQHFAQVEKLLRSLG